MLKIDKWQNMSFLGNFFYCDETVVSSSFFNSEKNNEAGETGPVATYLSAFFSALLPPFLSNSLRRNRTTLQWWLFQGKKFQSSVKATKHKSDVLGRTPRTNKSLLLPHLPHTTSSPRERLSAWQKSCPWLDDSFIPQLQNLPSQFLHRLLELRKSRCLKSRCESAGNL